MDISNVMWKQFGLQQHQLYRELLGKQRLYASGTVNAWKQGTVGAKWRGRNCR